MNTMLSNKRNEITARAGKLVADGVKLPRAYDNNAHILKMALPFMGENIDPLTDAKVGKAIRTLDALLSDLENNRPVSVVYSGETQKSDEQIVKYAMRYSRIQFEMSMLQADCDRRMAAYREKMSRVEKLVANDRPAFVSALGKIASVDIESFDPVSEQE